MEHSLSPRHEAQTILSSVTPPRLASQIMAPTDLQPTHFNVSFLPLPASSSSSSSSSSSFSSSSASASSSSLSSLSSSSSFMSFLTIESLPADPVADFISGSNNNIIINNSNNNNNNIINNNDNNNGVWVGGYANYDGANDFLTPLKSSSIFEPANSYAFNDSSSSSSSSLFASSDGRSSYYPVDHPLLQELLGDGKPISACSSSGASPVAPSPIAASWTNAASPSSESTRDSRCASPSKLLLPSVLQSYEAEEAVGISASPSRQRPARRPTQLMVESGANLTTVCGSRSEGNSPHRRSSPVTFVDLDATKEDVCVAKRPRRCGDLDLVDKRNPTPKAQKKNSPVTPSTKQALLQMILAKQQRQSPSHQSPSNQSASNQSPSNQSTEQKFFPQDFEKQRLTLQSGSKRRHSSSPTSGSVPRSVAAMKSHRSSPLPSPIGPAQPPANGAVSSSSSDAFAEATSYVSESETSLLSPYPSITGSPCPDYSADSPAESSTDGWSASGAVDPKEEQRKRRNREAALRCREKKRMREEKLSTTCSNLEKKSENLQLTVERLEKEKQVLTKLLLDHDLGCSCASARMRRISGEVLRQEGIESMKKDFD